MVDVSVSGLDKFYGENQILNQLTFDIQEGERVGLLGKNGAGKTTLFKILCGELTYEGGSVVTPKGKQLGIVAQIPDYPEGMTADDVLKTAFETLERLKERIDTLALQLQSGGDEAVLAQYGRLCEKFEFLGGYDTDVQLNKACNGLGIPEEMRARLFTQLSGGEKTRVNLARMILEDTDILLLDEPTNHLDMQAVQYLEGFLTTYKGTVIAISHDRYFLDHVVSRVIEIENGGAQFYSGNYSFYVEEKQARLDSLIHQYAEQEKKVAQAERAAEQMRVWAQSNTNLHKRAGVLERKAERLKVLDRPKTEKGMSASFSLKDGQSTEVITIHELKKSFEEKKILNEFSTIAKNGERIAIIGENGSGKTTLLNMLLQKELPDGGWVSFGPAVKTAFLPQIIAFPNEQATALETACDVLKLTLQAGRNRLAAFRFQGDDVFKPVYKLSGGERSRLMLCIIMFRELNLLILDEPTNHLDIPSREWIENAVAQFEGNLLFVSHDRYFINKFATRIWEMKDGEITDFKGSYEKYISSQEKKEESAPSAVRVKAERGRGKRSSPYTLERQLTAAERDISKAEQELEAIGGEIEEKASDFEALSLLLEEQRRQESELELLYAAWEEISAQIEE